jgi:RNA polymerase sigma-70 factor (sigma-E family)
MNLRPATRAGREMRRAPSAPQPTSDPSASSAASADAATGVVAQADHVDLRDIDREAAMAALFDTHHLQLTRLALLLGAGHDAEDLVSEAFCELHRRWSRLRDPNSAPAYLRSTVTNLARMRIRKLEVRRRHAHTEAGDLERATVESAESLALLKDDQQRVIDALQTLSTRQREALVLRYWLGLKETEIAEALGISTGAVKSHVFRGMGALTARLEPQSEEWSKERTEGQP